MPAIAVMLLVLAAACVPVPDAPAPTAAIPTPDAATYREPFVPVTRENANALQVMGQLTPPETGGGSLFAFAFSVDSTQLVALNQELVIGWDLITGERTFINNRLDALDVFYAQDKTEVYTLDANGIVRVLDGFTGVQQANFTAHRDYSGLYAFDADNDRLAVVSNQGEVRVWNPTTREAVVNFVAGTALISDVTFTPDGEQILIASTDGSVEVWRWADEERVAQLTTGDTAPAIVRVAVSPDGAQIAAGTDEDIRLLDVAAETVTDILLTGAGGTVDVLAYTRDGRYLLNSGTAEALNVWNPQTGELVASIPELGGEPTSAAFSPDGELMLTSVFQRDVGVWDLTTVGESGVGKVVPPVADNVIDVGWSSDGRTLALFTVEGNVTVLGIPEPPPTPTPDATPSAS
jgi:WD40 repeat protein